MCTCHSFRRQSPCIHGPTSHMHSRVSGHHGPAISLHAPHTSARSSARTIAEQWAARPRGRYNASESGQTALPESSPRPLSALNSTRPLRPTAAARRWPRRAAAAPWACRGSVLRTWAHISPLRSSTRTSSMRAMRGPFKHSKQQKWGTRGKGGGAGHRAHHRNAQRGRVVRNARARGRGSRSERSLGCSSRSLSSATCDMF